MSSGVCHLGFQIDTKTHTFVKDHQRNTPAMIFSNVFFLNSGHNNFIKIFCAVVMAFLDFLCTNIFFPKDYPIIIHVLFGLKKLYIFWDILFFSSSYVPTMFCRKGNFIFLLDTHKKYSLTFCKGPSQKKHIPAKSALHCLSVFR
jgi:hypothetical protein